MLKLKLTKVHFLKIFVVNEYRCPWQKNLKPFSLIFLFLFFAASCNTTDPRLEPELTLKLEDVSCTEAWLQLTTNNIQLPATINLLKNNSVTQTFSLSTQDSLLYIDSLLPNQSYTFQVSSIQSAGGRPASSNKVTATTLDTTSHHFIWQTFTFGQHSSSTLYDVAIINENNIWAVGEIYMNDSLGNPDPNSYNAVHWDGTKWDLKKIGGYGGWACHTVFAFSENDVWFEGVIKWDGINYTVHKNGFPLEPNGDGWQINKMWGSSSNDLYAVGNNGNIAHYNGTTWQRIESGTDLHIYDIWGDFNDKKQEWEILCVASTLDINNGKEVLKISGTTVNKINNVGLPWSLRTVWFISERTYFIGGDGFYSARLLGETWIRDINMPPYYKTSIRGSDFNDIVITGAYGLLMHFNGMSWYNYQDITYITGSYGNITLKRDLIVCTGGLNNGKAILTIGRR